MVGLDEFSILSSQNICRSQAVHLLPAHLVVLFLSYKSMNFGTHVNGAKSAYSQVESEVWTGLAAWNTSPRLSMWPLVKPQTHVDICCHIMKTWSSSWGLGNLWIVIPSFQTCESPRDDPDGCLEPYPHIYIYLLSLNQPVCWDVRILNTSRLF